MTTEEKILEVLVAILGVLKTPDRGHGANVEHCRPADRRVLEALLPTIRRAFGGDFWVVRDLFASEDECLRDLLRTLGLTSNQLGRLLKRTAGQHIDELRLQRVGPGRDGQVYVTKLR